MLTIANVSPIIGSTIGIISQGLSSSTSTTDMKILLAPLTKPRSVFTGCRSPFSVPSTSCCARRRKLGVSTASSSRAADHAAYLQAFVGCRRAVNAVELLVGRVVDDRGACLHLLGLHHEEVVHVLFPLHAVQPAGVKLVLVPLGDCARHLQVVVRRRAAGVDNGEQHQLARIRDMPEILSLQRHHGRELRRKDELLQRVLHTQLRTPGSAVAVARHPDRDRRRKSLTSDAGVCHCQASPSLSTATAGTSGTARPGKSEASAQLPRYNESRYFFPSSANSDSNAPPSPAGKRTNVMSFFAANAAAASRSSSATTGGPMTLCTNFSTASALRPPLNSRCRSWGPRSKSQGRGQVRPASAAGRTS